MFIHDLFKRRMPVIDKLRVYANDPDVFVTFTEVLKVGVNPDSQWDDPVGIYTYPVREMMSNFESKMVPFGGDRRLIYILRNKGKILELQDYSHADLDRDIETIQAKYWPMLMAQPNTFMDVSRDNKVEDPQAYWEANLMSWFDRWAGGSNAVPGRALWKITQRMASFVELRFPQRNSRMIWNSMFRTCGYDVISDRGDQIICSNEPSQAVFLHVRAFDVIEACHNDLLSPPNMRPYGDQVYRLPQ